MRKKGLLIVILILFIVLVGMIVYLNITKNKINDEFGFENVGRVYDSTYEEQTSEVEEVEEAAEEETNIVE